MKDYDVAVIGAGPVGCTFARYAAEKGLKVAIFEKKTEVGVPLQCAGLLGNKIKDVNIVPDEVILNEIYGACLYSPSNTMISMKKKEKPLAYVLDRVAYDKFLAQIAVDKGVELFLNHRVNDVDLKTGEIYLKDKKITAEIIVGTDGPSSLLSKKFNSESKATPAAQLLIDTGKDTFDDDYFQVNVNAEISPGFLWTIPLSKSTARMGLFADYDYKTLSEILNKYLESDERLKDAKILKKYYGMIPLYESKKDIVKDRAILIGDSASQVKPTTGGGLIIGFKCAKIAAEIVYNAISSKNIKILKDYQKQYKKMYKNELKMQLKVQKTYKSLSNEDLDSVILKLKEKEIGRIVSEYGDLDSQSPLMKEIIKSGLLFSVLPKLLSRNIFGL
ncbi:geranylgeranyl reductase family protein [Methanobacterium sp. ACI-7]|uniref:geranylgeranyl reductase family protein n=1 Tax=unclassified Methanobacterium TaxID=2627676 RepID=UPI0039C196C2